MPFSGFSKAKRALDLTCSMAPSTLHDLRRTPATGLHHFGVRIEVTEALLNHISGTRAGIVGIYRRHGQLDEMRAATAVWERHLETLSKQE